MNRFFDDISVDQFISILVMFSSINPLDSTFICLSYGLKIEYTFQYNAMERVQTKGMKCKNK